MFDSNDCNGHECWLPEVESAKREMPVRWQLLSPTLWIKIIQPQGLTFLLLRFESNEQPAPQQISTRQTGQKYSKPFVVTAKMTSQFKRIVGRTLCNHLAIVNQYGDWPTVDVFFQAITRCQLDNDILFFADHQEVLPWGCKYKISLPENF